MTHRRTEELKLVFALNDPLNSAEMTLGADKVKFQPRTGSVAPIDALNLLIARMQVLGIEATFIEGRKTISIAALKKRVETKGKLDRPEFHRHSRAAWRVAPLKLNW